MDQATAPVPGDRYGRDAGRGIQRTADLERQVVAVGTHGTRGPARVGCRDARGQAGRREADGRGLLRVDVDADLLFGNAEQHDLLGSVEVAQPVAELPGEAVEHADVRAVGVAPRDGIDHRERDRAAHVVERGPPDALRQFRGRGIEPVPYPGEGLFVVLFADAVLQLDADHRDPAARRGLDRLDLRQLAQPVLDRLGDERLDPCRRCARPGRDDRRVAGRDAGVLDARQRQERREARERDRQQRYDQQVPVGDEETRERCHLARHDRGLARPSAASSTRTDCPGTMRCRPVTMTWSP